MKLIEVKRNFQVLLVPNYRAFRITVIYVILPLKPFDSRPPVSKWPLRLRTEKAYDSLHPTRLEKLAQRCPATTQYSNPLLDSCPWEGHLFGGGRKCLIATGGSEDKKKAAANFKLWLTSLDKNGIVAYTDGSQKLGGTGKSLGTGSARILRWKERWLGMNGCSLGPKAEIYDAEILGLCGGLEAALTSPMVGQISEIHIFADNLSVAQKAGSIPNGYSQAWFARFKELAKRGVQQGKRWQTNGCLAIWQYKETRKLT